MAPKKRNLEKPNYLEKKNFGKVPEYLTKLKSEIENEYKTIREMQLRTEEEEAKKKAEAVTDIHDDEYKKSLRLECRQLEKMIKTEEKFTGLFNDEKVRIQYFWYISKKELEDK